VSVCFAADEIDAEIVKNLDFYQNMDVVQNIDLATHLGNDGNLDLTEGQGEGKKNGSN
jgi:hypothetical protein